MASLKEPAGQSDFATWWNGVAIAQSGTMYTRGDIILSVAETGGGVHVDRGLPEAYDKLSKGNVFNFTVTIGGKPGIVENGPELPIVRQCAFEVDLTLSRQVPELLS